MPGTSPTQRTLKAQKDLGRECGIVERFIQRPGGFGLRKDLFGFLDLIAITPTQTIGIQSCGQAYSEHVKKITEEPRVKDWLQGNRTAELWGWRKVKLKRGSKAMRWRPRIADILVVEGEIKVIERKENA